MKRLTQILLTAGLMAAAQLAAMAAAYTSEDLLLVFHDTTANAYKDVEFNLGSVSNYLNQTPGSTIPVSYDTNMVLTNFGGTLANVRFSLVAASSAGASQPRVWLSDADLVTVPKEFTVSKFSTIRGKVENVGLQAAALGSFPAVIAPSSPSSYSYIVSGGSGSAIATLGGDSSPVVVELGVPGTSALYQFVASGANPKPSAIKIGTFAMDAAGNLTFTAVAVTPVITSAQPANQTVRQGSAAVSFSIIADGATAYQWLRNGAAVDGGTNATLAIANVQPGNAGSYSVVVSNGVYGTITTSTTAVLTVTPAYVSGDLQLVFRDVSPNAYKDVEFNLGSVSNLLNLAAGTTVRIAYDTNLVLTNFGGTLANLRLAIVGASSASEAQPRVWLSDADLVTVPKAYTVSKQSTIRGKIENVGLQAAAITLGAGPLVLSPSSPSSYSYIVSGGSGSAIATLGGDSAPVTVEIGAPGTNAFYQFAASGANPKPSAMQIGTFAVDAAGNLTFTAAPATPVVISPALVSQTVRQGQAAATFSVTTDGATSYQWLRNGAAIAGATNATLSIANTQPGDAGTYSVVASNDYYGTYTTSSSATVTVTPAYLAGDLQLVFRDTSANAYKDVEFNLGQISNYLNRAEGTTLPILYDTNLVLTNFGGSLANVRFALVCATAAGAAQPRVWLSDADLVTVPKQYTVSKFSTIRGKLENVGIQAAAITLGTGPLVIAPSSPSSYSYIVSGGTGSAIGTLGGDSSPVTVEAGAPGTNAFYQFAASGALPKPSAIKLGTFVMDANGNLTFAASAVTPVITSPALVDQTVGVGGTASFSASSDGGTGYQWLQNGVAIPGQSAGVLTITNTQIADAGSYSVMVTNEIYATSIIGASAQLTVVGPPVIATHPLNVATPQGTVATFAVTATNAFAGLINPPFSYQWFKGSTALADGIFIAGATTPALTLSGVSPGDAGSYTVQVTNAFGSAIGGPAALTVTAPAETIPPKVAISTPKTGWETNQNVIKITGTASDTAPGAIARILVRVNGSAWQLADISRPKPNTANWTNVVTLGTGTNWVEVRAEDAFLNTAVATAQYFVRVPSVLTLVTNGNGSLAPVPAPESGNRYYVGRTYSLDVYPNPLTDNLFSNLVYIPVAGPSSVLYTANPAKEAQSGAKKISFLMTTNLALQGNFFANWSKILAGEYFGLYSDPAQPTHVSAGHIYFKTTSKLAYTGKIYVQGEKVSFKGAFDLAGLGTPKTNVFRKNLLSEPIHIVPQVSLTPGAKMITGTVSNGAGWLATFESDLKVWSTTNVPPQTWTGLFTMVLPGSSTPIVEPGGHGIASAAILYDPVKGKADFQAKGMLGDGEKLASVKGPFSKDGRWPFYVPVNKALRGADKTCAGSVWGWLWVTNGNITGDVTWNKLAGWTPIPPAVLNLYPAGFSNALTVAASPYRIPAQIAPLPGEHVIAVTNLYVQLGGFEDLVPNIISTNGIWNDYNKLVFPKVGPDNPQDIKMVVATKNGIMGGTFIHPSNPLLKSKIIGAVLQTGVYSNTAWGAFSGVSRSGYMFLTNSIP